VAHAHTAASLARCQFVTQTSTHRVARVGSFPFAQAGQVDVEDVHFLAQHSQGSFGRFAHFLVNAFSLKRRHAWTQQQGIWRLGLSLAAARSPALKASTACDERLIERVSWQRETKRIVCCALRRKVTTRSRVIFNYSKTRGRMVNIQHQ